MKKNHLIATIATIVLILIWLVLGKHTTDPTSPVVARNASGVPIKDAVKPQAPAPKQATVSGSNATPSVAPANPQLWNMGEVAVSATGGAMAIVQFGGNHPAIAQSLEIPAEAYKGLRSIADMTGLYVRAIGPDGEILKEDVVSDPRIVFYDYPEGDSGKLAGGVIKNNDAVVAIRLPQLPAGTRVEIYEAKKAITPPVRVEDFTPVASFTIKH